MLRRFTNELPLVDALAAVEGWFLESQLAITFKITPIIEGAGLLAARIELLRVESLLLSVRLGVDLMIAVILRWWRAYLPVRFGVSVGIAIGSLLDAAGGSVVGVGEFAGPARGM